MYLEHSGVWTIVAPGPSVQRIKREHLSGAVIAIYDAINPVEATGYEGLVLAQMKDGCAGNCPDCENDPSMWRPKDAILLLHKGESDTCFADYPKRLIFSMQDDFGYAANNPGNSAQAAIRIAKMCGATAFRLVSFDSCTIGDCRTYEGGEVIHIPRYDGEYPMVCRQIRELTDGMPVEWVTP